MIPKTRHSLPEWEVTIDGQVIGNIESRPYRSITFYRAIGIHRSTGERVNLESSPDIEERVEAIRKFWFDPMTAKQHLPHHLVS